VCAGFSGWADCADNSETAEEEKLEIREVDGFGKVGRVSYTLREKTIAAVMYRGGSFSDATFRDFA
jgi:hypothetical protein